ncbi:MAG: methionine adenosyltransferase [Coriobacteriia bacterium]|nr:methionine adenosyltransferase [Coriobacteriia bacterium]
MSDPNLHNSYVFTSESVTEGHPDKVCDQISDGIVDAIFAKEAYLQQIGYCSPEGETADVKNVRVACETLVTEGLVVLAGEIRTQGYVDVDAVVREVIAGIGYNDPETGFHSKSVGIINAIHGQSADIALGVDESYEAQHAEQSTDPYELTGAGDQGMMFGYACRETPTLMPLPIFLAHRLSERLTAIRKQGVLPYLRPDGKTQVSVRYVDDKPVAVEKVLISTQHKDEVDVEGQMKADLIEHVIAPVFTQWGYDWGSADIYVNPTGRFVIGGPTGDTGVTGRKIIVDTYGGKGRHGGGSFSGKDPTKVDRSAAYAARWVAKNIVAAGLADRCEVQVAYGIGMAKPLSLMIDTFGTNTVPEEKITAAVSKVFDLRPAAIIDVLDLRRPIYKLTSNYGHFGRELPEFTWEQTNRVEELKQAIQ